MSKAAWCYSTERDTGSDATADDPEGLARVIAHRILARFGSQTGLLGSGQIGVNWELQELAGVRYYLVRELRGGLPADKAGLKVGDRVGRLQRHRSGDRHLRSRGQTTVSSRGRTGIETRHPARQCSIGTQHRSGAETGALRRWQHAQSERAQGRVLYLGRSPCLCHCHQLIRSAFATVPSRPSPRIRRRRCLS